MPINRGSTGGTSLRSPAEQIVLPQGGGASVDVYNRATTFTNQQVRYPAYLDCETPLDLFERGEVGGWYDPSDLTPEKIAFRRNWSLWTDSLNAAPWTGGLTGVTASYAVAAGPDGSLIASLFTQNTANSTHRIFANGHPVPMPCGLWTASFCVKANGTTRIAMGIDGTNSSGNAAYDLTGNGSVTSTSNGTTSASITPLGDGWFRVVQTADMFANGFPYQANIIINLLNAAGQTTYTGDGVSGIYLCQFQLEIGSAFTGYQRITDFTTEFLAAYPNHTLFASTTVPNTALGAQVRMLLDKSRLATTGLTTEIIRESAFPTPTITNNGGASGAWNTATRTMSNTVVGTSVVFTFSNILPTATRLFRFTAKFSGGYSAITGMVVGTISLGLPNLSGQLFVTTSVNGTSLAITISAATLFSVTIDEFVIGQLAGAPLNQGNASRFGTITARKNFLTYSQFFKQTAWTKTSLTVGGLPTTVVTAPDGTTSVEILTAQGANGTILQTISVPTTAQYTFSVWLRRQTGTGTVEIQAGDGVYTAVALTSTLTQYSVTATLTAGTRTPGIRITTNQDVVHASTAQLEFGPVATAYQQIGSATQITDIGEPRYLQLDGVDDCYPTAETGSQPAFASVNQMTVHAGVLKHSDGAQQIVGELTATIVSNNGAFMLTAPESANDIRYAFSAKGTTISTASTNNPEYTAPRFDVLTGLGDIPRTETSLRVSGVLVDRTSQSLGTGNYSTAAFTMGARNNVSFPFNGRIYQFIMRGAASTFAEVKKVEQWIAGKMGIMIP